MLPFYSLVLQHPRLRRLECRPGRQVLLKREPFHAHGMGRVARHLQRRLRRPPRRGLRARAHIHVPGSENHPRGAGRRSVVRELRQGGHGTVVEPLFEFPGGLGSVDHRPRTGHAPPVDQGVVESQVQGGDARQSEGDVSGSLRARETDHAAGEVAGVQIGGRVGAALCFLGEGGARGGVPQGQ